MAKRFLFSTSLIFIPAIAAAEPHAHGVARADVAVDGQTVQIDMRIPAADLLGFEHEARTDAQKERVTAVRRMMQVPGNVVALNDSARCEIETVSLEIGPEIEAEEGHDDHAHKHDDDHDETHAETLADEAGDVHSEVHVTYRATCAWADDLTSIAFPYFSQETATTGLEVRAVSAAGALSGEITAGATSFSLRGLLGS